MIGEEGQLAQSTLFRRFHELVGPCALTGVSIHALVGYMRVGAGVSILHEVIIACRPRLSDAPSEAWIITRDDIRKMPLVRAFLDFIVAHLGALLQRKV
jgi:DNA-binding transcriptional LysR family regulator